MVLTRWVNPRASGRAPSLALVINEAGRTHQVRGTHMQRTRQLLLVMILAFTLAMPIGVVAQNSTEPQTHDADGDGHPDGDPNAGTHDPNHDPNYDPNHDPNYDPNHSGQYDPNHDPNYDPNHGGQYDSTHGDPYYQDPNRAGEAPPQPQDPAACDQWRSDASAKQDAFWSAHKQAWEDVRVKFDIRIDDFYRSNPTPEDEGPFWDSFWNDLNNERHRFESEAEDHRNAMRDQWFQNCGSDHEYHAFWHHYDDPSGVQDGRAPQGQEPYHGDPYGGQNADGTYHDPYAKDGRHGDPYGDPHAEPYHEYSEECQQFDDERRRAADEIHQRFRQEWESLEQMWRDFESQEHSEEEWRQFESDMRAKERQIRADEEAAFRDLESKYGHNDACGSYGGYQGGAGGPDHGGPGGPDGRHGPDHGPECDFQEMERLFREFDDRLRQEKREFERLQQDKFFRFEARMKDKAEAWDSEPRDPAEDEAFWAQFEAEWQAFDDRQHKAAESFYGGQERQREDFRMKQEGRCKGDGHMGGDRHGGYGDRGGYGGHDGRGPGGPGHYGTPYDDRFGGDEYGDHGDYGDHGRDGRGPGGMPHDPRFAALAEEMDIIRLECELKAREMMTQAMREIDAMWESAGDSGADHAEIELKMAEAELAMRKAMLECQKKMQAYWEEQSGDHFEDGRDHERMGSWQMTGDEEGGIVQLIGKYMTITGDTGTSTLQEIAVQGQVWLDGITTDSYFDDDQWNMGEDGHASWLTGGGEGVKMRLHDNPAGLIQFRSQDGYSFLLQVPSHIDVAATDKGWSFAAGEEEAFLRAAAGDSEWDASSRTLYVGGEAEFFVPGNADNKVLTGVANKHRDEIMGAAQNQQLGAEITITTDGDGQAVDDALVYDDVQIDVEADEESDVLAVTFSADSSEAGKSFVLNVDDQIVQVGGTLEITYWDVNEETGEETESIIHKASSLMDVLDATDDETAEYWIVEDEDGTQVIVSVPNWSTHRVKLSSTGAEVVFADFQWQPWMGYAATGLVGAFGAAIAMAFMRRRGGGSTPTEAIAETGTPADAPAAPEPAAAPADNASNAFARPIVNWSSRGGAGPGPKSRYTSARK